jgi:hypothetical protein
MSGRIEGVRPYFVFRGQVKKYKSFSSKEKQIWVIRGKKIKAKEKNRKGHSLLQRKNEN